MRHSHSTRPAAPGQSPRAIWIADALGLGDYSAALDRIALARYLLLAAALRMTLSAVAGRIARVGRETLRAGLRAALPNDPRVLEGRFAAALRRSLTRADRRAGVPLAIDIHKRPYYGDRTRTPGVTGGKRDRGTACFHAYATAVVLRHGHRHALALTAVAPHEKMAAVVDRLLAFVGVSGVPIRYVLLDRGFDAAEVFAVLDRRNLRFVVPVVRRAATAEFFVRGVRGWFDHMVESRRRECRRAVRVAVVPHPDGRKRPLVFACSGGFGSGPRVLLAYRRRFGIESSYRQLGECLARTTSRDRVYRLALVGVSLLIREWSIREHVRVSDVRFELVLGLVPTRPHVPTDPTTDATQTHDTKDPPDTAR